MKLRKYTPEQLREAVKESLTYAQVLKKLNVVPAGGNYDVLKKAIAFFDLDTSHFRKQGWAKGHKFGPKRPLSAYLSNEHPILSSKLRKRLIKEEVFSHQCSCCGLTKWNDQPIPLELDQINGDNKDNSLSNLRLLCPNCHAQTPTYRGKNIKLK